MIDPPPSHGRIKYPLGSISALTNWAAAAELGPAPEPDRDLSQTYKTKTKEHSQIHKWPLERY